MPANDAVIAGSAAMLWESGHGPLNTADELKDINCRGNRPNCHGCHPTRRCQCRHGSLGLHRFVCPRPCPHSLRYISVLTIPLPDCWALISSIYTYTNQTVSQALSIDADTPNVSHIASMILVSKYVTNISHIASMILVSKFVT